MTREPCPGTPHRGHTHSAEPCPLGAAARPRHRNVDPCVYECDHDLSDALATQPGRWVDPGEKLTIPDRLRYRVLATPWYDHEHSGRYPADRCVPAGWELEVTLLHAGANPYHLAPLGVTQLEGPTLDPAAARRQVVDYLRTLAAPLVTRVAPADVELWAPVGDRP